MTVLALTERQTFDRFCQSVDVNEDTGCWLWTGSTFADSGRGVFPIKRGGRWHRAYAHRVSYEMLVGPIPEGLVLDHLCNNKVCVAPEHLDPVTQEENRRRQTERQTHCKQGHPLDGDNLYTYARPGGVVTRHCRECRRDADRRHDERNRMERAS